MFENYSCDGQLSIFDVEKDVFKIDKPIRLIEMFAGVGSQAMAMRDLGVDFEHYKISEWEYNANSSYRAIHKSHDNTDYSQNLTREEVIQKLYDLGISSDGKSLMPLKSIARKPEAWQRRIYNEFIQCNNLGSITNISGKDLEIVDTNKYTYLLTYSFPCFTGDTLVLTKDGYKQIKDVTETDMVITHKNRYKKVLVSKKTGQKEIWEIKGMGIDKIKCTENHKFYVRKMKKHYPTLNGKRKRIRKFSEPEWVECNKLLDEPWYMGVAINQNSILPKWDGIDFKWTDGRKTRHKNEIEPLMENHSFWWLAGRWLGDGWVKDSGIVISCDKKKVKEVLVHIRNCGLVGTIAEEDTAIKIHISKKEFRLFFEQFGKGAINKEIPKFVFDMPIEFLKSFIDGYVSADGCFSNNVYKVSSISRKLIYGMAQLVAKAYKTPYRIYEIKRPLKHIICGREVNQNTYYQLSWKEKKKKQDKAFYEDGYVWFPIKSVTNTKIYDDVYDIEVEEDHSFVANGIIAHNCQDLSVAGKGAGMTKGSGTRSGLLWEVERLLNETERLPQVLLMENVPQVHGKKNMADFQRWIDFLESKGYSNHWQDLNAKHYGVAQNRNRTYMVSILGNYNYEFPKPIPLTKTMKDYLEDEVDEKYYINSEKAQKLIDKLIESGTIPETEQTCVDLTINEPKAIDTANCIKARYDAGISNFKQDGIGVLENVGGKQTVLLKKQGAELEKITEVANTLMARDYKGFGNQAMNGVIECQKKS